MVGDPRSGGSRALLVWWELGRDPADAACPHPPVSFGRAVALGDHREVSVEFTCEGARLRGTIYLPPGSGRHPAVIWLHGSGEQPRLSYGPLVAAYVKDGIAFFTYDKRGVGESEGTCCPDVYGRFNLVTADAVGAVRAATSYGEIDPKQVGFLGASAAGWVAPRAAETSGRVAFLVLASAGVLQHSLVAKYEEFAGGSESTKPRPSEAEIAEKLASIDRSGFDHQVGRRRARSAARGRRSSSGGPGDDRRGARLRDVVGVAGARGSVGSAQCPAGLRCGIDRG